MPRKRGPAPTPTHLKLVAGNPGKRPINRDEPQPPTHRGDAAAQAAVPAWLPDEAKAVWKRMAPRLRKMGLLTQVDVDALAAYCSAYARWKRCEEFLAKNGDVYPLMDKDGKLRCVVQWPQVSIARNALRTMQDFQQEFGLTPASRSRIHMPPIGGGPGTEKDDEESVAERLFTS